MKKYVILTTEALVQVLSMIVLYPVLLAMATYARKYIRHGFTYVCGVPLFRAWGRWYLPMIWLNWHY